MKEKISLFFLMALAVVFLTFAFIHGLDKEINRQEAIKESNCRYYSDVINRMAKESGKKSPCEKR